MGQSVEGAFTTIDTRLVEVERQARAFRVPILSGADPEDTTDGVTYARVDQGTDGVFYTYADGVRHRLLTSNYSKFDSAGVLTSESTTSTGYTDLATAGPVVNLTTPGGWQDVLIITECNIWSSQTGHWAYMCPVISDAPSGGTYTFGPNDVFSARVKIGTAQADQYAAKMMLFGFNPGAGVNSRTYSITAKYRSGSTNTAVFENRQITVVKL